MDESDLLIELEERAEEWVNAQSMPSDFYLRFAVNLDHLKMFYHPEYYYFGYIKAWCKCLDDIDVWGLSIDEMMECLEEYPFEYYQDYFDHYTGEHKRALRNHRSNEHRNIRSLEGKMTKALNHYSRSLVIRIDLAYQRQASQVSINDFYHDFEELRQLISARGVPFQHLVDYFWALEQGKSKGYHCHLALIFDGHHRHKAWGIANLIGELWKKITGNNGIFFNCHDPERIEFYQQQGTLGVGMISRGDDTARQKAINTIRYLARPDKEQQHLRVKPFRKMRSFQ